jgi:Holliday junction resolvase-like predicted endonuclease
VDNLEDYLMNIERNLLIAVLKLTRDGITSHELINREAKIPPEMSQELLNRLQNESPLNDRKGYIEVDSLNRLKLAVRAIELGADPELVGGFLQWKEFEAIAALTMERNGYTTAKNLRLKYAGRMREIDIVACKKPLAICVDCKHWHHGIRPAALRTIVNEQVERASALAKCLPSPIIRIECALWSEVKMVPAILSLVVGNVKFFGNVPIVPILQLQDFLNQLPAYADSITHFLLVSHDLNNRFSDKP